MKAVDRFAPTTLAGVPPLWVQLLEIEWPQSTANHLKRLTNSGGALTAPLVHGLRARFPQADLYRTEGVLQDIHWYEGIFGYFPTYALGAMIASQIKFNCPLFDIFLGNPNEENINSLIIWLNSNIHQKASLYSSDEMLQSISGENLNPKYYLDHLVDRFIK